MSSSKLTDEMKREMLEDASSESRRSAFLPAPQGSSDPAENLERLFALLRELEPFLKGRAPNREVSRGGTFIL